MTRNKNRQPKINPAILRRLAGERSYARGESYFASGAVTDLIDTGSVIKAIVSGNDDYRVMLRIRGGDIDYDCNCPVGEGGACCKHVVAAGLAWLAQQKGAAAHASRGRDQWQAIRAYLESLEPRQLVAMLLQQAEDNPVLRNELQMQAARGTGGQVDVKAMKQLINKAFTVRGYVDYRGMRRFLQNAAPVPDMLDDLWRDKQAAAVVELAEHALLKGFKSYERTDDSDGGFGDLLWQVAELYKAAVPQAGIDPVEFGKRLFELQMRDQWDFIHFQDYTECLGKTGLAVFRQAADAAWQKRLAAKKDDDWSSDRYTLTAIMEGLARLDNDVDALIAIKSRDLDSSYRYLEIAEILQKAKREDEALAWAERGRKAFPDRLDVALDEFLIQQYHKRKQHDKAMQLAWQHFTDYPSLEAYKRLKASATKASATKAKATAKWRDQALVWLHDAIKKQATAKSRSRFALQPMYHNVLAEIHLAEGDSGKALQTAREGDCLEHVWIKIATAREKDYPQDAIEIYQRLVETHVYRTNNDAYEEATKLVKKIAKLMQGGKRGKTFKAYLEQLLAKFKAKRNFVKMVQGIG